MIQIWHCLSLNGVSTEIIYSVPVFISLNLMAGVKSKAAHVDGLKSYLSLTSSGLPGPNFGQVFPLLAKCGVTGRIFSLSVGAGLLCVNRLQGRLQVFGGQMLAF